MHKAVIAISILLLHLSFVSAIQVLASSNIVGDKCDGTKKQYWGCLPGFQNQNAKKICDTCQVFSGSYDDCLNPGSADCKSYVACYASNHVMYSGNSFNCLSIADSANETLKVFRNGDCSGQIGKDITVTDGDFATATHETAHCISISGGEAIPPLY